MNLAIIDDCGERNRIALMLAAAACAPALEFRPDEKLPANTIIDLGLRAPDFERVTLTCVNDFDSTDLLPAKPVLPPKEFGMGRAKRWAR